MIIELLSQKGFVEGVDFSLENDTLTALPKTRMVDQEIEHPAVEEVLGAEGDVITPAQEAYTETIQVEETYYEELPSLDSLKFEAVKNNDAAMVINEFLKGKQIAEDDSINIDLFLSGDQSGWRFTNIVAPTASELFDLISLSQQTKSQLEINAEAKAFLSGSDWKILRHRDQLEMNIPTSLTSIEYDNLLVQRQEARDSIQE